MPRSVLIERARFQRQNMADSERRLWQELRSRRFLGYKFRRQVPVGRFIADFACKSKRLIIEVDGATHGDDQQEARDNSRTEYLASVGWRVVRFWTPELQDMENVAERIFMALDESCPHPDPLPLTPSP